MSTKHTESGPHESRTASTRGKGVELRILEPATLGKAAEGVTLQATRTDHRGTTRIAGEGVTVIEGGGGEEGVWTSSNVGAVGRWRRRPSLWCSRTPPHAGGMPRRPRRRLARLRFAGRFAVNSRGGRGLQNLRYMYLAEEIRTYVYIQLYILGVYIQGQIHVKPYFAPPKLRIN